MTSADIHAPNRDAAINRQLAEIGKFIATTSELNHRQLEIVAFMARMLPPRDDDAFPDKYCSYKWMERSVLEVINGHEMALHRALGTLAWPNAPHIEHYQTNVVVPMQDITYNTGSRLYVAAVIEPGCSERAFWPIVSGEQIHIGPVSYPPSNARA